MEGTRTVTNRSQPPHTTPTPDAQPPHSRQHRVPPLCRPCDPPTQAGTPGLASTELADLAGTRRVIEVGRKIIGRGRYGDQGTGRVQYAWVVDPDRVRDLGPGQGAFISGNACTYVQVAPYPAVAVAAAGGGGPVGGTTRPGGAGEPVPAAPAARCLARDDDALDDVFGGGAGERARGGCLRGAGPGL